MTYKVENIGDKTVRFQAFYAGKCDVLASDYTALLSDHQLAPSPDEFIISPEVISNEPLTMVSQPDQELEGKSATMVKSSIDTLAKIHLSNLTAKGLQTT